jgi:hypothetical protein
LVSACRGGSGQSTGPAPSASTALEAPAADAAVAKKEAHVENACPPMDAAKVAPFVCDKILVDAAVPPILDAKKSLAPFYERLAELARGKAKHHVKIGMYGDSNLTADAMSGRMRRQLQGRFGDGGHGYVALARPWEWYSHNDIHHDGHWKMWKQVATSTGKVMDGHYGFANIAGDSLQPGADVWVSTEPRPGAPVGWTANRFDLYYAKRPDGGELEVSIDGEVKKTLDTKGEWEAAFETFEVPDAKHEIKVKALGKGTSRVYGVAVEKDPAAIQLDSLGTGSLNMEQMAGVKSDTRRAQWAHRGYDLVIIQLGTNEFGVEETHRKFHKIVIDEMRAAIPNLPILILSPPDEAEAGTDYSDPRIVTLEKRLKSIAEDNGTAYWDFREAMGGDKSILKFGKKGLAYKDQVHLSKQGDEVMGDRVLCAVFDDLAAYLKAHPDAGCATKE